MNIIFCIIIYLLNRLENTFISFSNSNLYFLTSIKSTSLLSYKINFKYNNELHLL